MSDPWWDALEPVTTTIACRGQAHEVRWEGGRLLLVAHADVEAEAALAALGGDVPECVCVRRAWDGHATDPALVTLGRRPGEADLGFAPAMVAAIRSQATPARRDDLVRLFALPVTFIDRLVLTAMARAAEQWDDPGFRDHHGLRLGAALSVRAAPALQRLAAPLAAPTGGRVVVHCTPSAADAGAAVAAVRDAAGVEVTASVPFAWLSRVWGPGLSEPAGRFVLSRGPRDAGGGYPVEVAEWDEIAAGRWVVRARPARVVRNADGAWQVEP